MFEWRLWNRRAAINKQWISLRLTPLVVTFCDSTKTVKIELPLEGSKFWHAKVNGHDLLYKSFASVDDEALVTFEESVSDMQDTFVIWKEKTTHHLPWGCQETMLELPLHSVSSNMPKRTSGKVSLRLPCMSSCIAVIKVDLGYPQ